MIFLPSNTIPLGSRITKHNASVFDNKDRNRAGAVDITLEMPGGKPSFYALHTEKLRYHSDFSSYLLLSYRYNPNITFV